MTLRPHHPLDTMTFRRTFAVWLVAASLSSAAAAAPNQIVLDAEAKRVAVIEQVRPSVVAVFSANMDGGGSGVLIDPAGYALTNYHVVADGHVMVCGLADGVLYDAVLVGLDRVGDVALIKLLPKEEGKPFPHVKLGDSDRVRAGDWAMAMGNPFLLAEDFTPTVTYGLVSGVNRYQPPEGKGTLEYTDCIQIDASINPGNSGGPLFNTAGELIGINGRGSFDKRGRVNSGVGYAISINQIKNFLGQMYAGIDTDHATLGAIVSTADEDGDLSKMVVSQVLEESDAFRRGLHLGDQIIAFAGRPMTSTNQFKNVLGIYPKGWRLPITYRRENDRRQTLVRLMGNLDAQPEDEPPMPPMPKRPRPGEPAAPKKAAAKPSPALKLYEAKPGFANYYFNKLRQEELLAAFKKSGDFMGLGGEWTFTGAIKLADRAGEVKVTWKDTADGLGTVRISRNGIDDVVTPLKADQPLGELQLPTGSGGLLVALYQYKRLLALGRAGFEGEFSHGGREPLYPPPAEGRPVENIAETRVDCDVLRTKHAAFETKWYFDPTTGRLIGCESSVSKDEDPCELYFGDYRAVDGRTLPHRIEVRHGDKTYAVITVVSYRITAK